MTKREIAAFQKRVYAHYRVHGRDFPWRRTRNPYRIAVSEIMLQQTQADRVVSKYRAFVRQFPTVEMLAQATLADVLRAWQGLGYNRRAQALHALARTLVETYNGKFPRSHKELMQLPGIGHYTAGAILAFAFNTAVPIIETNIRTVYIHHFFKERTDVHDKELLLRIEVTLDREQPRVWFAALMDYGVHLKKTYGNASVQSRHHAKQSSFKGSDREIRGAIIRYLAVHEIATARTLQTRVRQDGDRIQAQLKRLVAEGLIIKKRHQYALADA